MDGIFKDTKPPKTALKGPATTRISTDSFFVRIIGESVTTVGPGVFQFRLSKSGL
jgi:hypothetical protein